jgi:hypothetical protein
MCISVWFGPFCIVEIMSNFCQNLLFNLILHAVLPVRYFRYLPIPNRKYRNRMTSVPNIFWNRSVPISSGTEFTPVPKYRTDRFGNTERPEWAVGFVRSGSDKPGRTTIADSPSFAYVQWCFGGQLDCGQRE